jgi:hypothetical protein
MDAILMDLITIHTLLNSIEPPIIRGIIQSMIIVNIQLIMKHVIKLTATHINLPDNSTNSLPRPFMMVSIWLKKN